MELYDRQYMKNRYSIYRAIIEEIIQPYLYRFIKLHFNT